MLNRAILQDFEARLRGQVLTPEHPHYDAARAVWNGISTSDRR